MNVIQNDDHNHTVDAEEDLFIISELFLRSDNRVRFVISNICQFRESENYTIKTEDDKNDGRNIY